MNEHILVIIDLLGPLLAQRVFFNFLFKRNQNLRRFILIAFLSSIVHCAHSQDFLSQEINLDIEGYFGDFTVDGGTGISFSDFNKDGLDDLSMSSADGRHIYFFENLGNKFIRLDTLIISNTSEGRQLVWVDFDNDDDKDLFYVSYDQGVFMYQNNGNFTFIDVTDDLQIPTDLYSATGGAFGDIDNDGYLDLYLSLYDSSNRLYTFNGFLYEDISLSSGTFNGNQPSFCANFFDFNLDGNLDLYVVNDKIEHPNALYMNLGSLSFVDVSAASGTQLYIDAMNAGIADYNQDGNFDIYVTDEDVSILLSNQGDSTFLDMATSSNVSFNRLGWGGNFFDVENDGDLDLYVSTSNFGMATPSAMYLNDNNIFSEPFYLNGGIAGSDTLGSFSNAIGDINNDGLMDIATAGQGNLPFRTFVNYTEGDNNFLKLELVGSQSNRDAYGAIVDLFTSSGLRRYQKQSTNAYLCQNSDYIYIGLEDGLTIDSIIIKWPYVNSFDTINKIDIVENKLNTIVEGQGVTAIKGLDLCLNSHEVLLDIVPSQRYVGKLLLECAKPLNIGATVDFLSESEILLEIGFETTMDSNFTAEIDQCDN